MDPVKVGMWLLALAILGLIVWGMYTWISKPATVAPTTPAVVAPVIPAPRDPATMIAIAELGGGIDSGSGSTGSFYCNNRGDDQIGTIVGYYDQFINGMQMQCKYPNADGTVNQSPLYGSTDGQRFQLSGPFTALTGRGGSWIDSIGGFGGSGGDAWSGACPSGTALVGADVIYGKYVGQVKPYCA